MAHDDIVSIVHEAGRTGHFHIVSHAAQRMLQRRISRADIVHAFKTATTVQAYGGDWRVHSTDCDGEELRIGIAVSDGVVVITVM